MIVGGGSAGWMTACTLIKKFPNKNITLLESPNIATVGVGESTIGGIKNWTKFLGIDDKEFLSHTDGSYKLSIKFTDFYKKGEAFHYPFGEPNLDGNYARMNDWWTKKFFYPNTPNSDYAECIYPQMALVNQNKITYNKDNKIPFDFNRHTAYHFDATKFALWLRDNYAKPRGVKHILTDVKSVEHNEDGIETINKQYKADLFIDCTGFKSLLLGKEMKEPFESYNDLLPNDSAWATRVPYKNKSEQLVSYTNCTAIENGWVWNIPSWERIGTGYVYSSKFVDDGTALNELKVHLKKQGHDISNSEFKNIKMRVGITKRLWVKNVAAIGLSAGFIEPLESNGLYTVHEFLWYLLRALERGDPNQHDKDNFTHQCKVAYKGFAHFVAFHYALSQRKDTPYWKANFNKTWSDHITELKGDFLNEFLSFAQKRNIDYHWPHEQGTGFHSIAAGFNYPPTDLTTLCYLNQKTEDEIMDEWMPHWDHLQAKKEMWSNAVKNEQNLLDFLKDQIYTEKSLHEVLMKGFREEQKENEE